MENKKVTIYDLAEEVGVSTATISRVIAGNYPVSQKTREKVQKVIDKYDYRPNAIARTLSNKKSRLLGFITPDITNPFFSQVFVEVDKYALEKGYSVLLGNSMHSRELESRYIRILLEQQAVGIILLGGLINDTVPDPNSVQELIEVQKGTKLVTINGKVEGGNNYSVRTDEAKGIELIIKHLVKLGHKKIGLLGGVKGITTTDIKVSTFKRELKKYNLEYKDSWQIYSGFNIASGEEGFEQLIRTNRELPTALLGINDMVGVGIIKASKRHADKSFSFVGFDDTSLAQTSSPELTSVRHPYEKLGKMAIEMIEDGGPSRDIILPPRLVVKESTLRNVDGYGKL
ncbi:LacI family DNA-binding transcriptional regulator [Halalkalibacter sp. AB-rgal2]|uniref:LacI family DNA-binding transcriptional regulator n=1 Tax=Halalkalibacter sp. AB-rgal2 TaxID=3242695 RepID=UPI00359DC2ED